MGRVPTRRSFPAVVGLVASAAIVAGAAGSAQTGVARHATLPAVSPDGRHIAYLGELDGRREIFVVGADGGAATRLTDTPEDEGRPHWSGGDVLVSRFADGWSTLVAIPATGGPERVVARLPGRGPQRLGSRVLFFTGDWASMQMSTSAADGSGVQRLSDGTGAIWNAAPSPDGTRIAYTRQDEARALQVWTMNTDGTGARMIGPLDGRVQMPAWSPDGRRLAVQVSSAPGATAPQARLWIVDVETGRGRPVAGDATPRLDEVPSWFPDGRRLAFQSDRSGAWEIWTVEIESGAARQITRPRAR